MSARTRPFDHGIFAEPRSMLWLRRIILPVIGIHLVLAMWSGYRAIVQVFKLDLQLPSSDLREQSTLGYAVVSSGRVTVRVQLEMLQGAHAETLAVANIQTSANAASDPRPKKGSQVVVLSPEILSRFFPGPATVRVTATGRSQWLRTPPPTVREAAVSILPRGAAERVAPP